MSVTMQQIADAVGVSRGTVDRALHSRGRVKPEVAEKILQTAKEMGYRTNIIGQALARAKHNFRLGVILQSAETPTMQDVSRGVQQAGEELKSSGMDLLLREINGLDLGRVLEEIDALVKEGVQGIALSPADRPELVERIDFLCNHGIPVVTLNSDVPNSQRLCFVGMDNYRAGQTAAWLTCQMLPRGGKVFIVAGHLNNSAHTSRLNGFLDALAAEQRKNVQLLSFQPCFDRDDYAHEVTQHILQDHPDLGVIYCTSHGQEGVCQALSESGLAGQVKVIAYDLNLLNQHLLQDGLIHFVIDQRAFEQGYRPPYILTDYLLYDRIPESQCLYTDISIRTKYNISS